MGFSPANSQLPAPFRSQHRVRHGTDRRTDIQTTVINALFLILLGLGVKLLLAKPRHAVGFSVRPVHAYISAIHSLNNMAVAQFRFPSNAHSNNVCVALT